MSEHDGTDDAADTARARRERRAWIAANHPDRGGDPDSFAEGLRQLDTPRPGGSAPRPRVTVYRSRSPLRRLQRLVRQLRRSRTHGSRRLL